MPFLRFDCYVVLHPAVISLRTGDSGKWGLFQGQVGKGFSVILRNGAKLFCVSDEESNGTEGFEEIKGAVLQGF